MPSAAGGYSWGRFDGEYQLIPEFGPDGVGPGFLGPDGDPANGVVSFNGIMMVNLCDPHCPEIGEPFHLYLHTTAGADAASTGPANMPSIADASFSNTFSISFSWDDPARRFSISSEGCYVSPVPLPPAVWLLMSAMAVVSGQGRLSRRGALQAGAAARCPDEKRQLTHTPAI